MGAARWLSGILLSRHAHTHTPLHLILCMMSASKTGGGLSSSVLSLLRRVRARVWEGHGGATWRSAGRAVPDLAPTVGIKRASYDNKILASVMTPWLTALGFCIAWRLDSHRFHAWYCCSSNGCCRGRCFHLGASSWLDVEEMTAEIRSPSPAHMLYARASLL